MKISQLTTDNALDVLCEITPFVSNIVTDNELMETVGKAIKRDGLTKAGVMLLGVEKLSSLMPIVLKSHRADVYGIVAVLNGMEPEEIARQNVIKTSMQIRDICKDKELLDFFRSCAEQNENE